MIGYSTVQQTCIVDLDITCAYICGLFDRYFIAFFIVKVGIHNKRTTGFVQIFDGQFLLGTSLSAIFVLGHVEAATCKLKLPQDVIIATICA